MATKARSEGLIGSRSPPKDRKMRPGSRLLGFLLLGPTLFLSRGYFRSGFWAEDPLLLRYGWRGFLWGSAWAAFCRRRERKKCSSRGLKASYFIVDFDKQSGDIHWEIVLSFYSLPRVVALTLWQIGPTPEFRFMEAISLSGKMALYKSQAEAAIGIPGQWRTFLGEHPGLGDFYGASPCTSDHKIHYLTGVGPESPQGAGDIFAMELMTLHNHFGGWGTRLYELARGIDHNPVVSNRIRKQISAEDIFPDDIPLAECEPHLRKLAEKVWAASRANVRGGQTIVLKLKTKEFNSLTRSLTPPDPPSSCEEFTEIGLRLCQREGLKAQQLYRLVGIGLSNFQANDEPTTAETSIQLA